GRQPDPEHLRGRDPPRQLRGGRTRRHKPGPLLARQRRRQFPWRRDANLVTTHATGPGCIIQNTNRPLNAPASYKGSFEVVVQQGSNLVDYSRSDPAAGWGTGTVISSAATGPASLMQSHGGGAAGDLEVVVPEGATLRRYNFTIALGSRGWHRDEV